MPSTILPPLSRTPLVLCPGPGRAPTAVGADAGGWDGTGRGCREEGSTSLCRAHACSIPLPPRTLLGTGGGGWGPRFPLILRNFGNFSFFFGNFWQFSAIFSQLLLLVPLRVHLGALCVPCAEVLLFEAAGGLDMAPQFSRNFPAISHNFPRNFSASLHNWI